MAGTIENMYITDSTRVRQLDSNDNPCKAVLQKYRLKYSISYPYMQVGDISITQGWIIHISVIKGRLPELLEWIVPVLQSADISFKIPVDLEAANNLLSGFFEYRQLGKLICIYPDSGEKLIQVTKKLIEVTTGFTGPAIPTDYYLGGAVYTRYGSFNPVLVPNEHGKVEKFIYNSSQELIPDSYSIPFSIPEGVAWPFESILPLTVHKKKKLLNGRYLGIVVLKDDVKGKVVKALNLKSWRNVHWCIVKQGKRNMCWDDHGRDIRDRLSWQFELHRELANIAPVPKAIDLFDVKEDRYFVMEYMEGKELSEVIAEIFQGRPWFTLEKEEKLKLLGYLLQIIDVLGKLHGIGYIHRDLNPRNFLVDKNGCVSLIDLELAYSNDKKRPDPPFLLGTPGFISPQQLTLLPPTVKDDIYGLGGIMIKFFTGMSPVKFGIQDKTLIKQNLLYLIKCHNIATLIAGCYDTSPDQRPDLEFVRSGIESLHEELTSTEKRFISRPVDVIDRGPEHGQIFANALRSLGCPLMCTGDRLWMSRTLSEEKQMVTELGSYTHYMGMYLGIGGVLHLINRLKLAGIDTTACWQAYQENWTFIRNSFLSDPPALISGLYSGSAGLAIVIAGGIKAGLIEQSPDSVNIMRQCLSLPARDLDLAGGVAGHGLALLSCQEYLDPDQAGEMLRSYVTILLQQQQRDGSWSMGRGDYNSKGTKRYGFSYGNAGIAYFLFVYAEKYNAPDALAAAVKCLDWLTKEKKKAGNREVWGQDPKNKMVDPWLDTGFSGIALAFIKAYEVTKDETYKKISTSLLLRHPKYVMSNYFSIASGIAGLGEIYLEAFEVFKEAEWQERAAWITELLLHTYEQTPENEIYWLVDYVSTPTADLMTGNAGIIHFLARFRNPGKLSFPLTILQ